ncbi:MAG: ATPase, T2SS/T4P/T4SS family [Candidatus Cloacimonetes bacterium]|nr:ATPase, T2SS/T4P/T4SS family [Candidatus Cloacimonadota bacterium]
MVSDKEVSITRIHVVQKVNQLLTSAISTWVSDIHFEPFEDVFRVRYRIDGVLKDVEHLPYAQKEEIISRIKIMSDLDIAEKRRPQDGKLVFGVPGKNIDVRVSVLPTQFGEKVVLRLLDREQVKLDVSSLGMDDHEIELFRKCIHLPYGMILVTGPTGSGKTTSLYSALSEINSEEVNITTIEDPIEYNLRH